MITIPILILSSFFCTLTTSLPQLPLSSVSGLPPYIDRLHITSNIQLRYARTKVESSVRNPGTEARKIEFSLIIPESAFISNFSMVTEEGEFVAKVEEKGKAEETYQIAVDSDQGAGLVSQDTRDSSKFKVFTNILPGGKVLFKLTYGELLDRKTGQYEHIINIIPGQIVDDLKIEIFINESLPLTSISVPELVKSNELDVSLDEQESKVSVITHPVENDEKKAHIVFQPDVEYQKEAGDQGIAGKLVIKYDVDRSGQDSEVQVLDGYFIHYFVPDLLETLSKHAVFVLDVSGSMSGEKLIQMKDAMFTVLDGMAEEDMFNIITFSSGVNHWNPDQSIGTPMQATEENKSRAIQYIIGLNAGGGTNVNQALLEGLKLSKLALETEKLPREISSMVVFLTDGVPTSGVTEGYKIKKNVRNANKDLGVSIFCIGFGRDADFDLVKDISQESNSFAKRIYEGSDAAIQLEGFYSEISSPLINNLKFSYVGGLVDNSSVSDTNLKTIFRGGEFVIAGKLLETSDSDDMADVMSIIVTGDGKYGKIERHINICLYPVLPVPLFDQSLQQYPIDPPFIFDCTLPEPVYPPRSKDQSFMQNLHAFLNIKQLLKKDEAVSRQKALNLALENNFVTELTSLVVVQPDGDEPQIAEPKLIIGGDITYRHTSYISLKSSSSGGGVNFPISAVAYAVGGSGYSSLSYDYGGLAYDDSTTLLDNANGTTYQTNTECSGQITLYSKTYLRGDNITLVDSENTDLDVMDNKAVSVLVEGDCCWRLYENSKLSGDSLYATSDNNYISVTSLGQLFRKVSSVKKIYCY